MIDYFKIFGRVNSLPVLPRTLFYSAIVMVVLGVFWSASGASTQASTALPPPTATPHAINTISPLLFGTNLGLFNSNDQVLTSAPTRKLLQQIHVQAIRIPFRSGLPEATMIKAAQTVQQMGAVPVVVLAGPTDPNPLTDDVKAVSDMSKVFANSTVYYEFGNEEDLMGVSATRYTASWNAVIPLLKKLAPQAQFAGPVMYHYDQNYLNTFLKSAQPRPNVVSWHEYTCVAADSKDTCIARIDDWSAHIANARATTTAVIGKELPIMISEWNYAPITSNDGKSNDTVFLSTWTQKAFQTLATNHVFASMQYFSTSSVPLIDSNNNLAVQGLAFQAMYNNIMKPAPTPTPNLTATASATTGNAPLPDTSPTATAAATDTPTPTPTATSTTDTSPTATATATTAALPTATNSPTVTPSPTATTTSSTSTSSIPTVVPLATSTTTTAASPTPTGTATSAAQNLYTAIQNTSPEYSSSLAQQDNAQWQIGSFGQGGTCSFTNNAYTVDMPQKGAVGLCESDAISIGDFALQVQMTLNKGDGGGIVFRDNGNSANYLFRVNADGTFALEDQTAVLASGPSPAIKAGVNQSNILTVIAQGQQISVFANGQLLASVTDSTSSTGKIGLFAVDLTNSTEAAFNDIKIWTLVTPGATPTATVGLIPTPTITPTVTVDATPTDTPTPTGTPTATPTATPQQLYKQVTSKQPGYIGPLTAQDAAQWQTGTTQGGGCSFSSKGYSVGMSLKNTVGICYANTTAKTPLTNFALQVSMKLSSIDGGGIAFRDNGHGFYRLRVGADGTFDLVDQNQSLVSGTSSAIKRGLNKINVLTIIAKGKQIYLYVNGTLIGSVQDGASTSGRIGLFAVDFSHPTTAVFTNMKAWAI